MQPHSAPAGPDHVSLPWIGDITAGASCIKATASRARNTITQQMASIAATDLGSWYAGMCKTDSTLKSGHLQHISKLCKKGAAGTGSTLGGQACTVQLSQESLRIKRDKESDVHAHRYLFRHLSCCHAESTLPFLSGCLFLRCSGVPNGGPAAVVGS